MTHHGHLRSDDDAPSLQALIADCGCLRDECACGGVVLEPPEHCAPRPSGELRIPDDVRHLTDGMSAYGD